MNYNKININSLYGNIDDYDLSVRPLMNDYINKLIDKNNTIDAIVKEISMGSTFDILLSIYKKQVIKFIKEKRPDKIYLIDCDELGLI